LLTPQNSVLLPIDHLAFQFANLRSHEPTLIVNNVAASRQQGQRSLNRMSWLGQSVNLSQGGFS
jgi:hypothetical protein